MPSTSIEAVVIEPPARLRGQLVLPGDKSISHRALMLATMAAGESRIQGAGDGADVRSTAAICRALGATVDRSGGGAEDEGRAAATVDYRVVSAGVDRLAEPTANLDCGNSGTSLRLFAGILAGLPFRAVLDGDDSLRRRPVARIIEPLRAMGATLRARSDDSLPPLTVIGRHPLRAVDRWTPVPSAQVKSAILLAGLRAEGRTTVREAVATRDHTERMLRARGIDVTTERLGPTGAGHAGGVAVTVEGGRAMTAIDERVPGDVSAAAFWLVAAAIHPDADLTLRNVGVNPTRRAIIDVLRAMGADIIETAVAGDASETAAAVEAGVGEPLADLRVRSSSLRAIELGPGDVAAAIDEIPILCLAAAHASGTTSIHGAGELRHKESDRIAGTTDGLRAFGVRIDADGDDVRIVGRTALSAATVDSLDDHRLAMTFAIAGLMATGSTTVLRPASASISYPGFFDDLGRVGS